MNRRCSDSVGVDRRLRRRAAVGQRARHLDDPAAHGARGAEHAARVAGQRGQRLARVAHRVARRRPATRLEALGTWCGCQSTCTLSRITGSTSRITWPRSMVATPSTRIWCDFDRIAKRPPSRPSMKYISHSGRCRSSRRDMIRAGQVPQLVDRARPRQRGAPYVVGQVEVLVVGPHRVGQPSRAPSAAAGGSAARTRCGRRSARRAGRSRSPTPAARRSRASRCASACSRTP